MKTIAKIVNWLFHFHRWSFLFYQETKPYKICLDCGKARWYNDSTMKLGRKTLPPYKHPEFDGTKYGWEKI